MLPSAKVKLPTVEPDAEDVVLENEPVPVTVKAPVATVPVVLRASSPKLIAPLESVMLPSAKVKLPTVEPDAEDVVLENEPVPVTVKAPVAAVPVVLKASFPKLIAPLESVMLPSAKVKLPTVEPDAEDVVLENEPVPVTVKAPVAAVPVVLKASSPKLIAPLESVMLPVAKSNVPSMFATSATVKSSVEVNCSA